MNMWYRESTDERTTVFLFDQPYSRNNHKDK